MRRKSFFLRSRVSVSNLFKKEEKKRRWGLETERLKEKETFIMRMAGRMSIR